LTLAINEAAKPLHEDKHSGVWYGSAESTALHLYPQRSARFVAGAELSSPRQMNKRPGGGGTPRGMAPKIKPSMQAESYSP